MIKFSKSVISKLAIGTIQHPIAFLTILSLLLTVPLFLPYASSQEVNEKEKLISLDFENAEIIDILKVLSQKGDWNIITSPTVKGTVTVKLRDVTLEQALEAILEVHGFTYRKKDNIIQVMAPPDLTKVEEAKEMETKVFPLKYAKASELQRSLMAVKSKRGNIQIDKTMNALVVTDTPEKLNEISQIIPTIDKEVTTRMFTLKHADADKLIPLIKNILSEGGIVYADKRTNTMVVTDTPAIVSKVSGMIKGWDEEPITKAFTLNYANPTDIEKKLADIVSKEAGNVYADERTNTVTVVAVPNLMDKAEKLIASWDKRTPQVLIEAKIMDVTLTDTNKLGVDWEVLAKNIDAKSVFGVLATDMSAGGRVTVGTLSKTDYEAMLEALMTTTDINLLASPKIAVVNNEEAKILVGSSEPYTVVTLTDEGRSRIEDTKFIDVGTKLTITPQINEDRHITLKIHTEKSSAEEHEAGVAPTVTTSEADTKVIVKDGETAIIAGLVKDEKTVKASKVPILGDIPLLGLLFRSKDTTIEKKELVIFVTPRIMGE